MKRFALFSFAVLGVCIGCSSDPGTSASTGSGPITAAKTTVAYADIQAAFDANCIKCHGTGSPKDGVSLVSYESLMKGGDDGAVVVPGDPDKSLLIDVLRGRKGKKQMPFGMAPLPEEVITKVETWIKQGAKA